MNSRGSTRSWLLLAALVLAGFGWFCGHHFWTEFDQYDRTLRQLESSASLANQIGLLQTKPDRAAVQSRSESTLAEAIEKSTVDAGVSQQQIARIEPLTARRASDADYLEHSTQLQLDAVTLEQLAAMLAKLRANEELAQLQASAVRISAPFQADVQAPETWNVELTLTYYVYSPKTSVDP